MNILTFTDGASGFFASICTREVNMLILFIYRKCNYIYKITTTRMLRRTLSASLSNGATI